MRHCVALVAGLLACGGSHGSPGDAPAADAPVDGSGGITIATDVRGTVMDQLTGDPIGGAQICAEGDQMCATADADGNYDFTLTLPAGVSLLSQVTTATGYLGRENLLAEDPIASNDYEVLWQNIGGLYATTDATTLLATQAGFTYPSPATGFVRVFVSGETGNVAATATIVGSDATAVYTNGSGAPDPAVTDTSAGGQLYFGNLAPGTYAVTVQAAGKTCTSLEGGSTINGEWPPAGGETLRIHITAGAMTTGLAVDCN